MPVQIGATLRARPLSELPLPFAKLLRAQKIQNPARLEPKANQKVQREKPTSLAVPSRTYAKYVQELKKAKKAKKAKRNDVKEGDKNIRRATARLESCLDQPFTHRQQNERLFDIMTH